MPEVLHYVLSNRAKPNTKSQKHSQWRNLEDQYPYDM